MSNINVNPKGNFSGPLTGLSLIGIFSNDFGEIMKVTFVKIVNDPNCRRDNAVVC